MECEEKYYYFLNWQDSMNELQTKQWIFVIHEWGHGKNFSRLIFVNRRKLTGYQNHQAMD